MATKIVNVSELKTKLASLLIQLEADGVSLYVTQHGKPKAVLVKYEEYEALLRKVEDLEDLVAMHLALSSPQEEAISLKDYELQRTRQLRD